MSASRLAVLAFAIAGAVAATPAPANCRGTVYLTLDTGNMSQAELMAGILARHGVLATFFLANERTHRGDYALDDGWGAFWRARVAEGHAFGSHTYDHVYLRAPLRPDEGIVALARPQFGPQAGLSLRWDGAALCEEIARVDSRLRELTGRGTDPFWRAPAGRAPAAALLAATRCGYAHVHWAPAGFLGDELPSESVSNQQLLSRALSTIGAGDILMAHLGIWSRKDPYAPTLEPLIVGLKARGLCFATLREHPDHARPARGGPALSAAGGAS